MNRDAFLARKNPKATQTVTLTDGATVKVRKLTQAEVEHSRRHYMSDAAKQLAGLRYVVCTCTLNDDDTPMFTPADLDDLTGISFDDINTLANAIGRFSGTYADPKNG